MFDLVICVKALSFVWDKFLCVKMINICGYILLGLLCLQKALKEKTEHVEQLLVERDRERSEIAEMGARCEEVRLIRYDMK